MDYFIIESILPWLNIRDWLNVRQVYQVYLTQKWIASVNAITMISTVTKFAEIFQKVGIVQKQNLLELILLEILLKFIQRFPGILNVPLMESLAGRVIVQGVKSLGGHFAYLCRGFEFYEVKKNFFCYYFSKRKWKYFYTFYHFYSEKSSKRAK